MGKKTRRSGHDEGSWGNGSSFDVLPALRDEDSSSVAHAALQWVPASAPTTTRRGLTPALQAFSLSLRPRARMFLAAFTSRSRPLAGHGPEVPAQALFPARQALPLPLAYASSREPARRADAGQAGGPDPDGPYIFEPKWDGFRSIIFRDGGEVEIGSRNERPMTRYFPELVAAVLANLPERCVIDGEIVIPRRRGQAAGLRRAAAAHPPGGQPGRAARHADARALHRLRPARAGRRRPHRAAVRRAPGRAGGRARRGAAPRPPDPGDHRP